MCEKCIEPDDHYERMARMISDKRTLDGIAKVIEEARAQKAGVHPSERIRSILSLFQRL
jgi:hypothetical protein